MKDITLKELLEAGCHFGHQTNRWHPKAAGYIYGEREGVHIIDLAKTRDGLLAAAKYLSDLAKSGGSVLFVGTKRQAKSVVEEAKNKVGADKNFYYLLERWPGGLLTNFEILKKNNLDAILKLREDIEVNRFVTKKEKLLAQRLLDKYTRVYGGLVGLTKLPDAVFFVDVKREDGAVREAMRTGVAIVGVVDTNTDPTPVTYPIPANDDAVGSIKIIIDYLVEAWVEGQQSKDKIEK
ncbi:MAG: 30S ribosomal protein S2 [Patescibacteria group bacterium]|nr:30S ribosomal protein S2 [Patescibacteria group bacterium]MCL5432183.1 30S ribosomal protein S2 [Patescibacteria group bacterium]